MSRKKITVSIAMAFVLGVIVTLSALFIFRKYEISADRDTDNTDYMGTAIISGFAIPIPNKYMALVHHKIGLSYSDGETFEMAISVMDGSYELTVQERASLDSDIAGWYHLLKPFDELAIDKGSYVYCVYEDEGETVLLAYKEADEEHVFEIMVRCLDIDQIKYQTEEELIRKYESYILIADSLLRGAKPTDEEDTPTGKVFVSNDMHSNLQVVLTETFVPYDTIYDEAESKLASYRIEDNFYMIAQEIKPGSYSRKSYSDSDRDITVTIVGEHQCRNKDAQMVMKEGTAIWTDGEAKVKSAEIDGKLIYYYSYTKKYQSMDEICEKYFFEAATNMKNGTIYRLSAHSETNAEALEIDTYTKFLTIEEP